MAYVPGRAQGVLRLGPEAASADSIVLLHSAQIAALRARPAGIIVRDAAPLSHRMIRLLGLGAPTVMIGTHQAALLNDGQAIALDGALGWIRDAAPDDAPPPATPVAGRPVATGDGSVVQLNASVRGVAGAASALAHGACAIGLVRSEFLEPPDGRLPDAAFFRLQLGELCSAAAPLPVTIRLVDVSDDKRPAWLPDIAGFGGALGLQGARLFGHDVVRGVIEAELEAIAALAADHPLRVIVPFLTRHEELAHWSRWLRDRLPATVQLGAMVETPAAALDLGSWFDQADFVAVGCNDLMQCLFAADRDRPELAGYLDPYAPPLYRFLRQMAEAAGERHDQLQLCGLLPQLQGVLPLLIGLGYRRFSVDPPHIPYLAHSLGNLSLTDAQQLAARACSASDSREVLELLGLPTADYRPYTA